MWFGNEHRGLTREALERADQHVTIPMRGRVESLNLSVTAAVALYELSQQYAEGGDGGNASEPPHAWQQLYAKRMARMQLQARRGSRSLKPLSESYMRGKSRPLPGSMR